MPYFLMVFFVVFVQNILFSSFKAVGWLMMLVSDFSQAGPCGICGG
jgi:hypothetical protein